MKLKLKRLALETWMCTSDMLPIPEYYLRGAEVVGKDGYYYDRLTRKAWFEVDGIAYFCDRPDDFLYVLSLYDLAVPRSRERAALETLSLAGMLNKSQRRQLRLIKEWEDLREIKRSGMRFRLRIRKGNS